MAPPNASPEARPVMGGLMVKGVLVGLASLVLAASGLVWAQATGSPSMNPNLNLNPDNGPQPLSENQSAMPAAATQSSSSLNHSLQAQPKPTIQLSPTIQNRELIKPRS
ncbi:hypothetical protein [Vampirovibrio sp.]|uniref:hypothetical protein n=1 Tax=Vampirovibrio sp. TaxID=2717857 RepID=UPI0035930AA9